MLNKGTRGDLPASGGLPQKSCPLYLLEVGFPPNHWKFFLSSWFVKRTSSWFFPSLPHPLNLSLFFSLNKMTSWKMSFLTWKCLSEAPQSQPSLKKCLRFIFFLFTISSRIPLFSFHHSHSLSLFFPPSLPPSFPLFLLFLSISISYYFHSHHSLFFLPFVLLLYVSFSSHCYHYSLFLFSLSIKLFFTSSSPLSFLPSPLSPLLSPPISSPLYLYLLFKRFSVTHTRQGGKIPPLKFLKLTLSRFFSK